MPLSIPKGLTREDVLRALADLDAGFENPFGPPTGYELVHEGRRYAPKAVIGLACRSMLGRILPPQEFSGGEAPGQANYVLRELGFTVLAIGSAPDVEEAAARSRDWSPLEVELLVADYFAMLQAELSGRPYSKAEHNASLRPLLNDRTKASVEFKHQNVSAAVVDMGLPYIEGYRPAKNYQKSLLPHAIQDYLDRHPSFFDGLSDGPILSPREVPAIHAGPIDALFEEQPEIKWTGDATAKPWLSRRSRKVDFASRDARNRELGMLGEKFAIEIERRRLLTAGRDDLAAKVEWVAQTCGDGVGFDVLSFDEADDSEAWLEVKTTGMGKHFPFLVSANEVRCSEDCPDRFRLYRVFDFGRAPRIYVVPGRLPENFRLEPVEYRAIRKLDGPGEVA